MNAMKTNNKSGSERHTRQGAQWRRLRDVYCTSAARPRTRDDRTQQTSKTEKRAEEDVWQCEKERDRRRRRLQWRTRRESLFAIAATPCLYRMTRTSNCEAMEAANHQAEVRQVIASVIEENRPKLPAILRLAFHDAGTFDMKTGRGGANGSIRLELDRPENAGLKRATRVIDSLYKEINSAEPGAIDSTVPSNDIKCSYADIIAISGAIAVEISGGPRIDIGMGRIDAIEADANDMLPQENASSAELKSIFQRMGLSTKDLISLSGAHTLGGKGYGDPLQFDNTYYSALLERPWESKTDKMKQMVGIETDHNLALDKESLFYIRKYARSQPLFFKDFATSYQKLTNLRTI